VSVVRFDIVDTLGRTDLAAAVHDASDSDVRALLVQAEGPNFSVGGAADEWAGKSYSWFRTFIAEVTNTYRAIEALEIPVVAAIRGQTGGGGLELALSADFIVAADDTVMCCAEVTMGQLPLAGGYQRLASLIGPSAARRMVMLGEPNPDHHDPRGRRLRRSRRSTRRNRATAGHETLARSHPQLRRSQIRAQSLVGRRHRCSRQTHARPDHRALSH
jgi:hypothetical protein